MIRSDDFAQIDDDVCKMQVRIEPLNQQHSVEREELSLEYIYFGKWCDYKKPQTYQDIWDLCAL